MNEQEKQYLECMKGIRLGDWLELKLMQSPNSPAVLVRVIGIERPKPEDRRPLQLSMGWDWVLLGTNTGLQLAFNNGAPTWTKAYGDLFDFSGYTRRTLELSLQLLNHFPLQRWLRVDMLLPYADQIWAIRRDQ